GLDASDEKYLKDITEDEYFGYPSPPIAEAERRLLDAATPSVSYFSMEYGLAPSVYHTFSSQNPMDERNILAEHEVFSNMKDMDYYHYLPIKKIIDLPIYSGGLGVLAGDSMKSAADLGISLAGIGILWSKGYFRQKFWFRSGGQLPDIISWDPHSYPGLVPLKPRVKLTLSGQEITLKLWKYYVYSYDLKHVIPLVLLDADIPENPQYFRELTDQLYRSTNGWIKICQRVILGVGGAKALEALGYKVNKYHLNEGHAAFAFLEVAKDRKPEEVKKMFAYTCHTPVEAGHDRFDMQELEAVLGNDNADLVRRFGRDEKHPHLANLTLLAINTSDSVNAVAKKHGEVTRIQFPKYKDKIKSITNGVHSHTWMSDAVRNCLLKYKDRIGDFEADPTRLANVESLKTDNAFRQDLWGAHLENKKLLAEMLRFWHFNDQTFTICWARRIATYKRPTMLLEDHNLLLDIARRAGPLQIIIAGKAHPADVPASMHMDNMLEKISLLSGERKALRICFLENYDTYFAKQLTQGVDVWLNNPLPPFEASGTSGMKAIANGVLQLSTLDGWVVEAADKGIGRIFGYRPAPGEIGSEADLKLKEDSQELYRNLEEMMGIYYSAARQVQGSEWIDRMIDCIVQAGFFNTHRMVSEYNDLIWKK
ncbi:MAG TPA: alpha-glucan family phosphorylase, partial [Candidatus Omnitrophota bacterium]|nr:alpha-glucan family phosphorylase [Candidatus Omnitrophota bacterium]